MREPERRQRTVLLAVRHPADCFASGDPLPNDATATITFGAPAKSEADDRASLNPADAAAVDALPSGSALLVVQRGPGAGSRYLLDTDLSTVGRHPDCDIFLDDITVSRRHVEFRRQDGGFRVHDVGSLNGTYLNGDRVDDAELAERRRGPRRQVPVDLLRQRREGQLSSASGGPDHHRAGSRRPEGGVPGRRHQGVEDPAPRERGARRARAHSVGLPQVLRGRHGEAPLHHPRPAGALPAPEGHPGAPRRPGPRAGAAVGERVAQHPGCADGQPGARGRVAARRRPPTSASPGASWSRRPGSPRRPSRRSRTSAWSSHARVPSTTTPTPW